MRLMEHRQAPPSPRGGRDRSHCRARAVFGRGDRGWAWLARSDSGKGARLRRAAFPAKVPIGRQNYRRAEGEESLAQQRH